VRRPQLIAAIVFAATLAPSAHAATPTGRLLVLTRAPAHGGAAVAHTAAVKAFAARVGARLAGSQVPQIGLVSVRARPGESLHALAQRLRRDPLVSSVSVEHRLQERFAPNDPAFVQQIPNAPPGTTYEWWATRENFPAAWDINQGSNATVAIIDSGVDASHPDLDGKIAALVNQDPEPQDGPANTDPDGHGTHVASLACADTNNGIGLAGAGFGCKLIVEKSDLSDSSVAASIIDATNRGAQAINMSFGSDPTAPTAPKPVVDAINYAYAHNVVMVAAAADDPITEQGEPSNVLQPTDSGADLTKGLGLDVTAADFTDKRASFAGLGTQISIAAYGAYSQSGGPSGLLGAWPAQTTLLDTGDDGPPSIKKCNCRTAFNGDQRYAFLNGTSMAAPQVAAAAALVRSFNPGMSAADVISLLKQTATRPPGIGWTPDLGWGILNAGAALAQAATLDRTPPVSRLTAPVHPKSSTITLRWTASDVPPPGVVSSGVAKFEVYHSVNGGVPHRFLTTTKHSTTVKLTRGKRYTFYTLAIDNAGNREAAPKRPDASLRLKVIAPSSSSRRTTGRR
jgi:serine protease